MEIFTLADAVIAFYKFAIQPVVWVWLCCLVLIYNIVVTRFGLCILWGSLAACWYGLRVWVLIITARETGAGPMIGTNLIFVVPVFVFLVGCTSTLLAAGTLIRPGPWIWVVARPLFAKARATAQSLQAHRFQDKPDKPGEQDDSVLQQQQAERARESERIRSINQAAQSIQKSREVRATNQGQEPSSS